MQTVNPYRYTLDWFDSNYKSRIPLKVNSGQAPGGPHSDFVMWVNGIFPSLVGLSEKQMRFADKNKVPLPYHIVSFDNTTGDLKAWVKTVSITDGDQIFLYFNVPQLSKISDATFVRDIDIGAEDVFPTGIDFSPDGMIMYTTGLQWLRINQYLLTSPFDITTATFFGFLFVGDVAGVNVSPTGVKISAMGNKIFVTNGAGATVYEYNLGTFFDVTTGTYFQEFSTATEGSILTDIEMSSDGTKMFVISDFNNIIIEYTLPTPFNLAGAVFANQINVLNIEQQALAITFNSGGTRMYILGASNGEIHEYYLRGPYDITLAEYVVSLSVNAQDGTPGGIRMTSGDTQVIMVGSTTNNIYEYTLFASFDQEFRPPQDIVPSAMTFNNDGSKMYVLGSQFSDVLEYDLSTVYDINSGTFRASYNYQTDEAGMLTIRFNPDGTRMFLFGINSRNIWQYNLAIPWEVDSIIVAPSVTFFLGVQDSGARGVTFGLDGYNLFMVGDNTNTIYQYDMEVPYDVTSLSYSGNSYDISAYTNSASCLIFNALGTEVFVGSNGEDVIYKFELKNGFNLSDVTFKTSFKTNQPMIFLEDIAFNPDGTKMYLTDNGVRFVKQYTHYQPFDNQDPKTVWADYENVFYMNTNSGGINSIINQTGKRNGESIGGPFPVTGKLGKALTFNGTSQFVEFSHNIDKSFRLMTWVGSNTVNWNDLGTITSNRSSNGALITGVTGNKDMQFYIFDTAGFHLIGPTVTIPNILTMHRYGVMYDDVAKKAYTIWDNTITEVAIDLTRLANTISTTTIAFDTFGAAIRYGNMRSDDYRFQNSVVSTDFIITEFNNQNNVNAFYDTQLEQRIP